MNKLYVLILVVCCLLGVGCRTYVSPYTFFYTDETGGLDVRTSPYFEQSDGFPIVIETSFEKASEAEAKLLEDGYIRIGHSSFNKQMQHEHGVTLQAKKVHAAKALWYTRYTHAVTGSRSVPHIEFKTDPSGTITREKAIYRTETYKDRYFDHGATYWVKLKDNVIRLGVVVKDVTANPIGRDQGMRIDVIRKNSPAYEAGLETGDLLRRVGDIKMNDLTAYREALEQYAGTEVPVVVMRQGEEITKEVTLNQGTTISDEYLTIIRIR